MTTLIHKELSYAVRGVLFEVYNKLGPVLPEKFYQQAVALGLEAQGIVCQPEKMFEVFYRAQQVGLYYVDLWIEGGKIILSIKKLPVCYNGHLLGEQAVRLILVDEKFLLATVAVKRIEAQLQEHLKARLRHLGLNLGLLANFNDTTLQVRFVRRPT